jgi:S1-C subfamily serine protease
VISMPDDSGFGQAEYGQGQPEGSGQPGGNDLPPGAGQPSGYPQDQPGYGAGQPGPDTTHPGYSATQPVPGATQPGYGAAQPGYAATEPGQGATQPGYGAGQPGYGPAQHSYVHPGGYSHHAGYMPGYAGYGSYGPPPPPPPNRRHGVFTHVLVAVVAAAVAAGGVLAFHNSGSSGGNTPVSYSPGGSAVPNPGSGGSGSSGSGGSATSTGEQNVVNKVEPGIVLINTNLQYDSEEAAGTGMVINSDGLVLTNNHVIENSTKISATVVSTGKTYSAEVIGYDKTGDVALIRLEGASGLRTVPLGDSSTVKTGTPVVALGNAEGQSAIIPAVGSITGLNKTITASDDGGSVTTETLHGMLQTNAGIVSGDSGGPLSTTAGQVIGMDTAGDSSNSQTGESLTQPGQSTGFAIPINTALAVARQIAAGHGSSTISIGYPPFVGIYVSSGTSSSPQQQAEQQEQQEGGFGGLGGFGGSSGGTPGCYTSDADLGVPSSVAPVSSGSLVIGTICGSPAASAGLTAGSVITSVNGQTVGAPTTLTGILSKLHPGDSASVTWVSPGGKHTTSQLHLVAGPPQ